MEMYLKLLGEGLIIVGVAIICYLLKRKTKFGNLKNIHEQIIIGIIFGGLAVLGTEFGVQIETATANVRDAAALTAGLLFGWPAGIIAGFIGGVERFFAAYWGRGMYTQVACSISTIIAGLFGAFLRKFMLDDKRASGIFGFVTACVMEVFHLTLIFFTHMDSTAIAIETVEIVTLPMVLANAVSVSLSCFAISLLSIKIHNRQTKLQTISKKIQMWLLIVISLCFVATSTFVYFIQTNTAESNAEDLLKVNLNDVCSDLTYAFEDGGYETREEAAIALSQSRSIGETGFFVLYDNNNNKVVGKVDLDITDVKIKCEDNSYIEYKVDDEEYLIMCAYKSKFTIVALYPHTEAYALRDATIYINSFMEILAFSILYILIYFLIKQMVITNMLKINKTLNEISSGNLDVNIDVRYTKEFNELSDDINKTIDTLKRYIDEEKQRIDKELSLAKLIQTSSLPQDINSPDNQFDIHASMYTAKEVGGDFYDFYMLKDNKLAFLIADVSGKGIPAAMFMMKAKTIIKSLAEADMEVNDVLSLANHKLCNENEAEMFVTVWLGFLDLNTGVLKYANAGHNPPLLFKNNSSFEYLNTSHGLVLAGLDNVKYKANEITLNKNDRIFLYTDGVTEATSIDNELYGEERLKEFLNTNKELNVVDLLDNLKQDIDKFANGREQFDDITMLGLDFQRNKEGNMKEKTFIASTDSLEDARTFVEEILESNDVSFGDINKINLAFEEIFVNIANYAYKDKVGEVIIQVELKDDNCVINFIDEGVMFNPLEREEPNVSLKAEERKIGGLGIFLVKKIMDDVKYERVDGKNIFSITKKIR